ncbi:MAG: CDP-diacylglycerol--glycerol-3-phosphate 3-phosphatidyltransferase [Clostridia bacterium]|nr:CDP-diacylglycerol--glycerol-3-phosphate 3-phosphatidyltransferase [Clostridia bacterium]
MNLPNKLSIIRVALIPVIVILLYQQSDACRIIAGALFIIASLTDFLDGFIARKYNLVTNFGKFIDPVADKLLVLTTLIMLLHRGQMEAWIIIIILCRELAVDGLRLVAVTQGKVIAASPFGKIKTTCQMIMITAAILLNQAAFSTWYMIILTVAAVVMTLFSAVDYFMKNRAVFSEN